jgi:hypothetical protein
MTGRETLGSVEIFDLEAREWSLGPAIPFPVHGVGAAAWQGAFYLMGGSDRAGAIENVGRVQVLDLGAFLP